MNESTKPPTVVNLRVWPALAIVIVALAVRLLLPLIEPDATMYALLSPVAGALAVLVWWLTLSRAPHPERWALLGIAVAAIAVARPLLHESVSTASFGFLFFVNVVPLVALSLVVAATAVRAAGARRRRAVLVAAVVAAVGIWPLLRIGGVSNTGNQEITFRWLPTPEEQLLANAGSTLVTGAVADPLDVDPAWPGFRGPNRDSIVDGVLLATDWAANPPRELWRHQVGPGWSSFAVQGNVFYTQEQRGDEEVVAAYALDTGEPIWLHGDPVRFWEANAGAGPRGTPTLHDGRLYALGATGVLNALDPSNGDVFWSRNAAADAASALPVWGFSSSPVVVNDTVVVALQGKLAAYDRWTGTPKWFGPDGRDGYSSPHVLNLDGVEQVVFMSMAGALSVDPDDGTTIWEYDWPGGTRIVQPALTTDGDLLMSRGVSTGLRRVAVTRTAAGWSTEERWRTNFLKPYYSDFVVHDGNAYGFDGNLMASIELTTGDRNWKGGRYGGGQLILVADQNLLVVTTEFGDLALVAADPRGFEELARIPVLDDKTWNHPVLVGDTLLIRNDREMVGLKLATHAAIRP